MSEQIKVKGKNLENIFAKRGGGGQSRMRFRSWRSGRGEGATQSPNIRYANSDISLITKKSSRLVSHFSYIRILLRVISKGRDKIVEIGSNGLLSHL